MDIDIDKEFNNNNNRQRAMYRQVVGLSIFYFLESIELLNQFKA